MRNIEYLIKWQEQFFYDIKINETFITWSGRIWCTCYFFSFWMAVTVVVFLFFLLHFLFMQWVHWNHQIRYINCVQVLFEVNAAMHQTQGSHCARMNVQKRREFSQKKRVTYFCGCNWKQQYLALVSNYSQTQMNQIFEQILNLCHFLLFSSIQTKQCSRSLESHLTVINETECLPWISTSALRIWIMKCRKYNAYKLKKKERQNEHRRSYVFCVLIFVVVVCQSLGFGRCSISDFEADTPI